MLQLTGVPTDPHEREKWAIDIVSDQHKLHSPYLAQWVVESIIDGELASESLKDEVRKALTAKASRDEEEEKQALVKRASEMQAESRAGYLYLIQAENGLYKIGVTYSLRQRIKTIANSSPCKIEVLHIIKATCPYELERMLHEKFSGKLSHSEWFHLSSDDVDFFGNINGNLAQ